MIYSIFLYNENANLNSESISNTHKNHKNQILKILIAGRKSFDLKNL